MKKISIFFILIFFSSLLLSFNASAFMSWEFGLTNDPDTAYTNDPYATNGNWLDYAYTNTVASDNWLYCYFGTSKNACVLSNATQFKLAWYHLGSSADASYVDIDLIYENAGDTDGWNEYHNLVTDGSYTKLITHTVYFDDIVFLNGIRIRSNDPSHFWVFRIYDVQAVIYAPTFKDNFYATTDAFDLDLQQWFNTTQWCNYANCSSNFTYDFENFDDWGGYLGYWGTTSAIDYSFTGENVMTNYTCSTGCSNLFGIYYLNYTDINMTFKSKINYSYWVNNCTLNLTHNITNATVNNSNWLDLMSTLTFDNSQFYLIIMLSIWVFMLSKSYDEKTKVYALLQFVLFIPIFLYLVSVSYLNSLIYGYLVSGSLMFASIFVLITGTLEG